MQDDDNHPDLRDHRIEEGGWQKPTSPPKAEARPAGLPSAQKSRPRPAPARAQDDKEK